MKANEGLIGSFLSR